MTRKSDTADFREMLALIVARVWLLAMVCGFNHTAWISEATPRL
jgi:hypothetical protein